MSSGSDSEGPAAKRPKRSFTPTSDDGDMVVEPVGDHIDDTPPPPDAPVIRQAMAFNWDKGNVPTYQATVAPPKKGPFNYFLPGQAPISASPPSSTSTLVPATAPSPTPTLHTTYSPTPSPAVQPSPSPAPSSRSAPRRKAVSVSSLSTPRNKKSEGKARHFNDKFANQTGRFKIGAPSSQDSEGSQRPAITHGSGPYSSMYRMEMGSPVIQVASGSSAPSQPSSRSRKAAQTHQTSTSGASHSQPGARPSNAGTVASLGASTPQPKASGSKSSTSKHRSSTKQSATNPAPSSQPQHYRHDYERENASHTTSRNGQNSNTRSQASVASTPRHHSHPREAASSPSLSNTTLHTTSGENLADTFARPSRPAPNPKSGEPLRMLTLLINDIRSGVDDHQLAEVRVPMTEKEDCFWANSLDVCEQLQQGPSRIDGPARVYAWRKRYRQFFLRVSADNSEDITSSNLQVERDRSLEIFVEPLPEVGALPNRAQIPRRKSPSPDEIEVIEHSLPFTRLRNPDALKNLNHFIPPLKRRRSRSPHGVMHQEQFAHISPHHSASPSPGPSAPPPSRSPQKPAQSSSSYDYSLMSPRDAEYYQKYSKLYKLQPPSDPNTNGRMGNTPGEVDASIVRFIKPLVEEDPQWMVYMQSKGKPQVVSEVLKQYRFVQAKIDEFREIKTPIFWDGAPDLPIEKQHVWQILGMESPTGPDCEETLALVALYGPGGSRYEDARVLDMIEDKSTPKGKPYKRFLKLLRSINLDWLKDHPEDADDVESDAESGLEYSEGPLGE